MVCAAGFQLGDPGQYPVRFTNFQGFEQHSDETDPERIRQITSRSVEDAAWVVKKVFTFFVFLIERDGGSLAWAIELLILTSWVRIQPRTVLLYYILQKFHQWRVPLKGSEQPILMDQLFPKIVPFYLYRALTKKRSTFVPRVNQFSQLVNSQICHFRYYTADYCWLEHWYLCISFSIFILYLLQSNTFLTAPSSGLL